MAAVQYINFARSIMGDGVSTSITIDYSDEIKSKNIRPLIPSNIISATSTITPSLISSTLSGMSVTFTFSGVIDSGAIYVNLGF